MHDVPDLWHLHFTFTTAFHIRWTITIISLAAFLFIVKMLWLRATDV